MPDGDTPRNHRDAEDDALFRDMLVAVAATAADLVRHIQAELDAPDTGYGSPGPNKLAALATALDRSATNVRRCITLARALRHPPTPPRAAPLPHHDAPHPTPHRDTPDRDTPERDAPERDRPETANEFPADRFRHPPRRNNPADTAPAETTGADTSPNDRRADAQLPAPPAPRRHGRSGRAPTRATPQTPGQMPGAG